MTIGKKILLGIFLLIIINFTFQPALAQINETVIESVNDTIIAKDIFQHKNEIIILNATFTDSLQKNSVEDIYRASQNNFEYSLSILNLVGTLMAVLVGLITLIVIIAIACGIFEYKQWVTIRNNVQVEANIIRDVIKTLENDVESARKKMVDPQLLSADMPSKEVMENLEQLSSKLDLIELLGVALEPEDFLYRARDFYYKKEYDSALSYIEKGIELHPDNYSLWLTKSSILDELEQYQEGLKSAEKSINLNPNSDGAWCNKGVLLQKIGRYDEAIIAYEKSLALRPEDPTTLFDMACCYSLMENKKKMLDYLERAITRDPIFREKAKIDIDFEMFLDDEDFKNLIE